MRRYVPKVLIGFLLLLALDGCSTQGVLAVGTDDTLPKITQIKRMMDKNSVGFEWPAITDARVKGVKVYRAVRQSGTGDQRFKRIATIDDRYATHFVDNNIRANKTYLYTFTTYSVLYESSHGQIVKITTHAPFAPVSFLQAYQANGKKVKVLWKPHPNPAIAGYIIERKVGGGGWKYLASITGRLMPEYIDRSAAVGYHYSYRIVARSGSGIRSLPSEPSAVTIKPSRE